MPAPLTAGAEGLMTRGTAGAGTAIGTAGAEAGAVGATEAAGAGVAGVVGALAGGPWLAAASLLGSAVKAWLKWRGMSMQKAEVRRAERRADEKEARNIARDERHRLEGRRAIKETTARTLEIGRESQMREDRMRGEDIRRRGRERRENIARSEKWKELGFQSSQEAANFQKVSGIVNGLTLQMNRNPQMANNLVGLWRGRRAA